MLYIAEVADGFLVVFLVDVVEDDHFEVVVERCEVYTVVDSV